MEKQDLYKLLELIREELPDRAEKIASDLESLKETLDGTIESFIGKMQEKVSERIYDISDFAYSAEQITEIQVNVIELISLLITEDEKNEILNEDAIEDESKKIKNYSDYEVDSTVEHFIDEPFTHRRPMGFRLNDGEIIETKTWKDVFIKTCENLIEIDEEKFLSFEDNEEMQGRGVKYFSKNVGEIKEPTSIKDKVYVASIKSGEAIRAILVKMFEVYAINKEEFKIYLRADYTEMNM